MPIRDVIPSRTTPYVTIALILANALVFLAMPSSSTAGFDAFIRTWGLTPADVSAVTLATAPLVHAGTWHLASTMLFLWIFGQTIEDRMGHGRYLVFYLLCGLAAMLVQVQVAHGSPAATVGASGSVSGLLGAYLVLFPQSRVLTLAVVTLVEVPAVLLVGIWFTVQLLGGLGALAVLDPADTGNLAFLAHAAACAAGASLVVAFRRPERMQVDWWDTASLR